ncbi:MAG: hypothetical protein JGK35_00255 [Microcoleus sp. PH2017_16_JOR_D_A]|uniref:hypothetical protein n=1 Tax=Microcoleus sp. PH2017_16_JOR_D_A TaxID=2798827 RepID=UPI001D5AC2F6|nr:hypothetical protein [Microcoleus sp. PH2017_16_JOR_D_A]MCC3489007.1 hypothetical protein [Microcoleus sp. PH2017_16_JOR_D_A]
MSNTELVTESLTEHQWGIAHAIAQTLVKEQTDVNELGKAIAYLRNAVNLNQTDANSRFFKYLKTLVGNGRQIGHSGKTTDYYRSIDKACSDCLKGFQGDARTLLQILGWASRLMRYYKQENSIVETAAPKNITEKPKIKPKLSTKNISGSDSDGIIGINRVLARPHKPPKHK